MLSFDEAKQIALERIGPECVLLESATLEKPYGWYFGAASRAFIETADPKQMALGSGGFIVEKTDGRVFEFGSAFPLEKWIANYEKGFKNTRYDLTILAVSDLNAATGLLHELYMHYVVPGGSVWDRLGGPAPVHTRRYSKDAHPASVHLFRPSFLESGRRV